VEEFLIATQIADPGVTTDSANVAVKGYLRPARKRIGEMLVDAGLLTQEQVEEALRSQTNWGSRLGDIVLAMGWVKPQDFYRELANHFDLQFVDLVKEPADEKLFDTKEYAEYAQYLYVPWRRKGDILWIATAQPGSEYLYGRWGIQANTRFVVTSKFDVLWELQRVAGPDFNQRAVFELARSDPDHSARVTMTESQKRVVAAVFFSMALSLFLFPVWSLVISNAAMNLLLLSSFVFRALLSWISFGGEAGIIIEDDEVAAMRDTDLPVYSVLVPMYKEPEVLPILAAALRRMDYPRSKLDVKLVLEEGDLETIAAAKAQALDATIEIIRVPYSEPRTKPKACNYALRLARGRYLTIYDAEDKPDSDQLKKAVLAFRKLGGNTACVQARLNYFNAEENWLTRMFTLEYSTWFDIFLPALDRLRVPIPLGGTSNHFDLAKLREVGAWDPFNVTEDADLGLRFAALGYHVGVVNSVTYEEANSRLGNWIRQRSRWIKGYIQTWLVNMRHPVRLFKKVGLRGFCTLQLFIGGSILSGLVHPLMLIPFLVWVTTRTTAFDPFFPRGVLIVSVLNLTIGNACHILLSMLGAVKRRHYLLLPYALMAPAYWFLQSVAAYKALWQLITRPFYWEKTAHGISKFTKTEIERSVAEAS